MISDNTEANHPVFEQIFESRVIRGREAYKDFTEMRSYLISIISRLTIFVLILNFTSCKILKQNVSNDINNKPLIAFLNCSISYDSIRLEYNMDLINKIITEGKIKKTTVDSKTYEKGDLKYCLLNKNNQIISFAYMQNPLDKTIEYIDENGLLGKKSIELDSTSFSLRIQTAADCKFVSFEKDDKQLLLVNLNE